MLKAVLFDLDGTLLDTLDDIMISVNNALKNFSYPPITREETRRFVGDGAHRLIERATPQGGDVEGVFSYFSEDYAESAYAHTKLYEGELRLLSALKKDGIKLAVVTNKPQRATERCIRKCFPEGTFDCVMGDSGLFPVKPDPTSARFAALTLRVSSAECAFVGDGETDVKTAKNADMFGVATLWGYRDRAILKAAGATVFASDFSELEKIFKNGGKF